METIANPAMPVPLKPVPRVEVCPSCWSAVNWCESFAKFGHDQGDDCVHTEQVARALRTAGCQVETKELALHNTLIVNINRPLSDGTMETVFGDDIPVGNDTGYSDPREILPPDLVKLLDDTFGKGEFFG